MPMAPGERFLNILRDPGPCATRIKKRGTSERRPRPSCQPFGGRLTPPCSRIESEAPAAARRAPPDPYRKLGQADPASRTKHNPAWLAGMVGRDRMARRSEDRSVNVGI